MGNANTQKRGLPKNLWAETIGAYRLPYSAYDFKTTFTRCSLTSSNFEGYRERRRD